MEQTEIFQHVKDILNKELLISLATCNKQGVPWASIVEFVTNDDLTLYWMSDPRSRHSQNIEATGRVAGTVTLPLNEQSQGIGLQLEGTVRVVTEMDEKEKAHTLRDAKRGRPTKPEMLETRPFYALTPDRIYLIHEPLLGYKRLELDLAVNNIDEATKKA